MAPEARAAFLAVGWKVFREVASLTPDRTDYAAVRAPVLVLGGGKTPAPEQRVLATLAPLLGAELRIFPELGHMGPITHAAQVNDAIATFVARH
jgi:pimeloyl-ACP methyl ester carboxylesterase